jgi:hypothetical protein
MNARYRSLVLPLAVVAAACSTGVEANVDGAVNLGFAGFNSTSTPASGAAPQRRVRPAGRSAAVATTR